LRARSVLLLMVTVTMWAGNALFTRYLAGLYNVWTQNAFRYICAAVTLVAIGVVQGRFTHRLTREQWQRLLLVTAANLCMQTNYAAVFYFIYPAVAILVVRLNIIFTTVLSFALFHDERGVIRSPRFIAGATLAFGGVIAVIIGRNPELLSELEVSEGDFWIGIGLSVSLALFSSLYAVAIKHAVRDVPPLVTFTHVSWTTALGLALLMFVMGGVSDLWHQPPIGILVMVLTALLSIVLAHGCYYAALREVKAVVSTSILQLTPVITCILSALVYGDRLTPLQIAGGAAVIGGAWLAALAQARGVGTTKRKTR